MTANIRNVERADASSPQYCADHAPIPGALDCRPFAGPDAPRDLMPDEVQVLRALHGGAHTTADVLRLTGGDEAATRAALYRLVLRGEVGSVGDTGHAFQLTNPSGRALAAALAAQP